MEGSIFNSLPMLFFVFSPEGVYLDVLGGNDRKKYENAKQLTGHHVNAIFEDTMASFMLNKINEVASTQKVISFNYAMDMTHFKDKNHTTLLYEPHWFEVIASPILDEYNKVSRIFWSQFSVQHYKKQMLLMEKEMTEFKKMAMQDELTGLYNRRYLYKKLEEELAYIRNHKNDSKSLLSVSIDNLKNINKDYGLFEGDKAIEFLAESLLSEFKSAGICTRFREDNFIIILHHSDIKESEKLAEAFRLRIQNFKSKEFPNFTVSIGITEIRRSDDSIADIFERLEEALFYAKKSGKNKVYTTLI